MSNRELRLELKKIPGFDSNFTKNPIWEITYMNAIIINSSRLTSNFTTDDVYFVATVKRGSLYYMINNVRFYKFFTA